MATGTYTPIASITLGSSASSVTFSSIPQDYRDLVLISNSTVSVSYLLMQLNGDTGNNYHNVVMWGTGSSNDSSGNNYSALYLGWRGEGTNIFMSKAQIMDYSATDKHKAALIRDDYPHSYTDALAGRWANTQAVTSIRLFELSGTILAGSTFALYGIEA